MDQGDFPNTDGEVRARATRHPMKWRLRLAMMGAVVLAVLTLAMAVPRTHAVMLVSIATRQSVDAGTPSPFTRIRKHLVDNSASLEFRAQVDAFHEKSVLEGLLADPAADFAIVGNTGSPEVEALGRFTSLGVVRSTPILFFVRAGDKRIHRLKDLRGKKIISWSSPEGSDKPMFTPGAKASPYSSDYVIDRILDQAGVTLANSTLVNPWPRKITLSDDWDVWMKRGVPTPASSDNALLDDIKAGRVVLARMEDLEGVNRRLPALRYGVMPASAWMPSLGLPETEIPYLAMTESAIVRKGIDPGVVVLLAEALKKVYGPHSLLANRGDYPTYVYPEPFRADPVAEEFYRKGRPALAEYLTPTLAIFLVKVLLVLIPLVTLGWPVVHFLPALYQFYIKHVLARWYEHLELMNRTCAEADEVTRQRYLAKLESMHREMQETVFPVLHLHNVKELYSVRGHLESVRSRVKAASAAALTHSHPLAKVAAAQ